MSLSQGVRFMLLASFTFTLMKVCVKLVPHIPAIEIILFRSVISMGISLYFLGRQKVNIWGNNKPVLIGRGVAGALALVIYFSLLHIALFVIFRVWVLLWYLYSNNSTRPFRYWLFFVFLFFFAFFTFSFLTWPFFLWCCQEDFSNPLL